MSTQMCSSLKKFQISQADCGRTQGTPLFMRDARGRREKTEFRTKVLGIIHVGRSIGGENKICLKLSGRIRFEVCPVFQELICLWNRVPPAGKAVHNWPDDGTSWYLPWPAELGSWLLHEDYCLDSNFAFSLNYLRELINYFKLPLCEKVVDEALLVWAVHDSLWFEKSKKSQVISFESPKLVKTNLW